MKKLIFMGILGLFILGSCNNKTSKEKDEHGHTEAGHEGEEGGEGEEKEGADAHKHADEISFCPEKAKAVGMKVHTVQPSDFQQVIKTSGQVTAAQGGESTVVATVAGVVSFRGKLTEGISVGKGTTLITISSEHIAEGDPVLRARVDYQIAKKEYDRMKKLIESKIISEKEFAVAQQNYENAKIGYQGLAQNHSGKGQQISSNLSGYVKAILVKEGEYVTVGQPLVSITQNKRLFLRAEVSEKYYNSLQQIQSANFKTPYDNKVYELKTLNGKLLSFGKTSGDNSFYIPVTFEFDNKGAVVPGAFVEVYLLSSTLTNVIAIPRTALTEEQGHLFVYLQVDEEGYKRQEVTIGADNGKNVQILTGLKTGDRVVSEGAYQLRLASSSQSIPAHSHEH